MGRQWHCRPTDPIGYRTVDGCSTLALPRLEAHRRLELLVDPHAHELLAALRAAAEVAFIGVALDPRPLDVEQRIDRSPIVPTRSR